jgi:hypothetical protein
MPMDIGNPWWGSTKECLQKIASGDPFADAADRICESIDHLASVIEQSKGAEQHPAEYRPRKGPRAAGEYRSTEQPQASDADETAAASQLENYHDFLACGVTATGRFNERHHYGQLLKKAGYEKLEDVAGHEGQPAAAADEIYGRIEPHAAEYPISPQRHELRLLYETARRYLRRTPASETYKGKKGR